jgi:hypothetical protein
MRLLALSSCLCSSVLSWVTLLVFECLMIQSFKVLSLILKLRGASSDALLRVGLTCLPVVVDSLEAILLQCSVWVVPASCGTLPSLSRLRSPTSHLFNLLVLVGGYLDRVYLLPVPESHCPPKDYSSHASRMSTAVASLSADSGLGKTPTARERRLISRLRRSR